MLSIGTITMSMIPQIGLHLPQLLSILSVTTSGVLTRGASGISPSPPLFFSHLDRETVQGIQR
jgi:hypothetical protein